MTLNSSLNDDVINMGQNASLPLKERNNNNICYKAISLSKNNILNLQKRKNTSTASIQPVWTFFRDFLVIQKMKNEKEQFFKKTIV